MPGWILFTQWVSRLVLAMLVGLSVWSVSIMIGRYRFFKRLRERSSGGELEDAKKLIRSGEREAVDRWSRSKDGLGAGALRVALDAPAHTEPVDRAVRSYLNEERPKLEEGLTVLATLGSNAPFVGLFGTVLGIIQAFGELSQQQSGTQAVIGGVSEALVATAIGLFVAIPAVVAYNVFSKQARSALGEVETLRDLFVAHILGSGGGDKTRGR